MLEYAVYDGLNHLVHTLFLESDSLMSMFALYCDDSGTHAESEIAIAACYVSTVDQWRDFQRNWDEVRKQEGFDVFHMADFEGGYDEFADAKWKDVGKRERTLRRLVGIIKARARIGFAAIVQKSAYDRIVPQDLRDRFELGKNHYTFVVRQCLTMLYMWRQKYGYQEKIDYVFDRMTKGKGEIDRTFEVALERGEKATKAFGMSKSCWTFGDKSEIKLLQAADILAWETYRHMTNVDLRPPERRQSQRESFVALNESPLEIFYHNEMTLTKLVQGMD